MNDVTLDGVMQAPGRPEEDTRGGFTYGGWGRLSELPDDAVGETVGKAMDERMAASGGLAGWLFGRRTYEDLPSYWNRQPDSPTPRQPVRPGADQRAQVRRVEVMADGLIDEYLLMIHPLVLGSARRLFPTASRPCCASPTASQRPPAW